MSGEGGTLSVRANWAPPPALANKTITPALCRSYKSPSTRCCPSSSQAGTRGGLAEPPPPPRICSDLQIVCRIHWSSRRHTLTRPGVRQSGEVACSHSHTHPHCNILTLSHIPTFSHSPTSSHSHTLTHSHILTLSRILTFSHSATFSHSRTLPHSHILALSHILTIAHSVCFDKVHRADEIPSTFLALPAAGGTVAAAGPVL